MFPINQFVIKKVSETATDGVYHIGPLPTGFGNTLGTVFRRILLSAIPGAAITSVRIDGVEHEYTTVAGLQDEVLKVVLAMKNVAVVCHTDQPVNLKLSVKGKKGAVTPVTASDFEKDPMVEIVNPDYVITNLADENATLDLEVTIEKGIGYALPNEAVRQEVGAIPVDAIFNPVKSVSVDISHTRVGQQTDLDQVELHVITNGAVSPGAAMCEAAQILEEVAKHLVVSAQDGLSKKAMQEVEEANLPVASADTAATSDATGSLLVSELKLSTRLANALINAGFEDLKVMEGLTEEELRNIKGMGDKTFQELLDILKENNIKLI